MDHLFGVRCHAFFFAPSPLIADKGRAPDVVLYNYNNSPSGAAAATPLWKLSIDFLYADDIFPFFSNWHQWDLLVSYRTCVSLRHSIEWLSGLKVDRSGRIRKNPASWWMKSVDDLTNVTWFVRRKNRRPVFLILRRSQSQVGCGAESIDGHLIPLVCQMGFLSRSIKIGSTFDVIAGSWRCQASNQIGNNGQLGRCQSGCPPNCAVDIVVDFDQIIDMFLFSYRCRIHWKSRSRSAVLHLHHTRIPSGKNNFDLLSFFFGPWFLALPKSSHSLK